MEKFDRDKATTLFKSGLGKAEGEFIASIVAPFYWYWRTESGFAVRNGSIFFWIADGVRLNRLAGVVYSGPKPDSGDKIDGFEVIRARRANFIMPDGRLDRAHWP
jgi:hypothetical protein